MFEMPEIICIYYLLTAAVPRKWKWRNQSL